MREFEEGYGKWIIITLVFFSSMITTLHAQNVISITASAMVTSNSEIELVTIYNILIDETSADNGIIHISPVNDALAGKLLVKGQPDAVIRITFSQQPPLVNSNGKGTLVLHYEISGYNEDNQRASQLLDVLERSLKFNKKGEYYLWVGGRVDITNARPGSYEGEFTLEIEYL